MSKSKKILIAVIALVVVIAALLGLYFATRPATSQGAKAFTVEVTHADGSEKTFQYRTDEEYVGKVLLDEGLIQGEDGQFGLYILTVDGEDAIYETDGAYWAFYVNGDYANQGIDLTPAEDGAVYGLVYTLG